MAFQAIVTKYLGATNHKSSRIKATAQGGSITVSWDHDLNVEQNHRAAAEALVRKMGWTGQYVAGGLPSGDGNVYVCVDTSDVFIVNDGTWKMIDRRGDYFVWFNGDVYQVTKTDAHPTNAAGYRELETLLKLKGIA